MKVNSSLEVLLSEQVELVGDGVLALLLMDDDDDWPGFEEVLEAVVDELFDAVVVSFNELAMTLLVVG